MPRDASGNYTLPAGNPVISGTTITSIWANATMPDIGAELTDSLSRSGQGGMLVPLRVADGIVTEPAYSFTTEISLGMYREAAGILGFAAAGALQATVSDGLTGAQDVFTNEKLTGFTASGLHTLYAADLDDILNNSTYHFADSQVTNAPADMVGDGFIYTDMTTVDTSSGNQIIVQRAVTGNYKIWLRGRAASVWEAWLLIVDGGAFTLRLAGLNDNGTHIRYDANVDDIAVNSFYHVSSTFATGLPADFGNGHAFIRTDILQDAPTNAVQTIYGALTDTTYRIWMRSLTGGVWGAWKLVVDGGAFTERLAGMNDDGKGIIYTADIDLIVDNSQWILFTGALGTLPPDFNLSQVGVLETKMSTGSNNAVQILTGVLSSNSYKVWMRHLNTTYGEWKLVVNGLALAFEAQISPGATPAALWTDLPAGISKFTLVFQGISSTLTANPYLRIGNTNTPQASGYNGGAGTFLNDNSQAVGSVVTTAHPLGGTNFSAGALLHGKIEGVNLNPAGNVWLFTHNLYDLTNNTVSNGAGSVTIAGDIQSVQLAWNAGNYAAGALSLWYE